MKTLNEILAKNMRRLRGEVSISKICRKAEMPDRHWSKIEKGRGNVTLRTLQRIAFALNVDAATLLKDEKDK